MLNLFNVWRVLPKSVTARVTLRLPNRETARFFSIAPFLNLASENGFVLIVAWLLGALRAGGPYPVLAIAGKQGSAKLSSRRSCGQ
jgi:hypothetical protein